VPALSTGIAPIVTKLDADSGSSGDRREQARSAVPSLRRASRRGTPSCGGRARCVR
jgi:hypothetical protein